MAWHVFEKLLEGVANYSTFIGKLWITFFFIFRIIMVASIGDTVYNDEQSAFICNTLQPGCTNVCFNQFSPISQIRFWAVQILFVGMPSVIFIVFAMHKMSSSSVQEKKEESQASRRDRRSEGRQGLEHANRKTRRSRHENGGKTGEKSIEAKGAGNHMSLPQYDDFSQEKKTRPAKNIIRMQESKKGYDHSEESFYSNEPEKKKVKMKTVYNNDGKAEVMKTPSIARAYFAQTIITTMADGLFLYLQYHMYKFEVRELYECIGDPCPKQVDCYVSRPKEKTLFLLFMYAMTSLSILINVLELLHLIKKYFGGSEYGSSGHMKNTMMQHKEYMSDDGSARRYRHYRRHSSRYAAYPELGPFLMKHGSSFTDTDNNDSIDSDYRYYAK